MSGLEAEGTWFVAAWKSAPDLGRGELSASAWKELRGAWKLPLSLEGLRKK
jgi:hypothetical protein